MAFMVPEYHKGKWYVVENEHGETTNVPDYAVGDNATLEDLKPYVEGREADSFEEIEGVGVHLSAPGYLDQTEWTVFDTEEEARQWLIDFYNVDPDSGEELPNDDNDKREPKRNPAKPRGGKRLRKLPVIRRDISRYMKRLKAAEGKRERINDRMIARERALHRKGIWDIAEIDADTKYKALRKKWDKANSEAVKVENELAKRQHEEKDTYLARKAGGAKKKPAKKKPAKKKPAKKKPAKKKPAKKKPAKKKATKKKPAKKKPAKKKPAKKKPAKKKPAKKKAAKTKKR